MTLRVDAAGTRMRSMEDEHTTNIIAPSILRGDVATLRAEKGVGDRGVSENGWRLKEREGRTELQNQQQRAISTVADRSSLSRSFTFSNSPHRFFSLAPLDSLPLYSPCLCGHIVWSIAGGIAHPPTGMRRTNASDLHLHVPHYSAEASNAALRTPSIASTVSYTHRPAMARTMSTTSMISSDGEGAMESDWTQEQEILLQSSYEKELTTFSHNNPPFVPSAPPPALLSKVSKRAIKADHSWPHSLAQTRKHLLLLVRRNAPEPSSPHVAPKKPTMNPMSAITDDLPGFFSRTRERSQDEMLNSPFDERTFDFDKPISPRKERHQQSPRCARPDLMKEGSFGFGVPLTPNRKSTRILERPSSPSHSPQTTPTKRSVTKQRAAHAATSPTRRKAGDEGEVGRPGGVAGLMLSPRRSSRIRVTKDTHELKRTNSALSLTD